MLPPDEARTVCYSEKMRYGDALRERGSAVGPVLLSTDLRVYLTFSHLTRESRYWALPRIDHPRTSLRERTNE
jgi:hypothetical protein